MQAGTLWWYAGVRRRSSDVTSCTAAIPHARHASLTSAASNLSITTYSGFTVYLARIVGHFADSLNMATYSAPIIAIPIRRESEPPTLSQCWAIAVNPLFTDWAQNVHRRGIFLNNSRWYRVTILPIFPFVHCPTDTKNHHSANISLFTYGMLFFNPTRIFCTHGRCSICPTAKDRKADWKCCPVLRMGMQGPLYQDNSNKMRRLQGTIIPEKNLIHICVLKYIFLPSNIPSISLFIISWKMRNLNKSNILTTTKSINRTFIKILRKLF
jgi:hypothetical protein